MEKLDVDGNESKPGTNKTNVIGETNQFITFKINDEIYGVDVLKIHEIIGMTKITHVPNSMDYMKGMINLRDYVVPVVDMRIKFNMPALEYDDITVILIVEVMGKLIGMIVDTVSDVIKISKSNIHETPHFSVKIDTDFIMNIGKADEKMIILLDVDKILTSEEWQMIEPADK